jgi:hypothetical protein
LISNLVSPHSIACLRGHALEVLLVDSAVRHMSGSPSLSYLHVDALAYCTFCASASSRTCTTQSPKLSHTKISVKNRLMCPCEVGVKLIVVDGHN